MSGKLRLLSLIALTMTGLTAAAAVQLSAPPPVQDAATPERNQNQSGDDGATVHTSRSSAMLEEAARQALGLRRATVQSLDVSSVAHDLPVCVTLDGVARELRLWPYSMRVHDFKLLVQDAAGIREVAPPEPATYRGHVADDPTSQVAASVIDGRLSALIHLSNGDTWAVEPLSGIDGAGEGFHVAYRDIDVIGGDGVCGVDDSLRIGQPTEVPPSGTMRGGGDGRTQIAYDADVEFFQQNGSSVNQTVADIELVMNQVGLIYQNQVGICYAATGMVVRTTEPDPYSAADASTLLNEFTNHWNAHVSIPRDVAHLFTGKPLGNIIGIAWVGVICRGLDYGLSVSRFHPSLVWRAQLTAHELGHNWNACHCNQSDCGCFGMEVCGIMNSFANGSTTFGPCTVSVMTAHRNSRGCLDPCFDPTYVNRQNNGPEDGSAARPFNTFEEGVAHAIVGGQIIIASGNYPERFTISKPLTVTASGGAVTIGD